MRGRNFLGSIGLVFLCIASLGMASVEERKTEQSVDHVDEVIYVLMEFPPLINVDDNGYVTGGLFVDIVNEIFVNRLKQRVAFKQYPWKRGQQMVEGGAADMLLTIPTEQRKDYAIATDRPVFELFMHLYTYKNHPKLNQIKKINSASEIAKLGLVPVSNRGNSWHKENIDVYGVSTNYVKEDENIAKFLAAKRADLMIEPLITMNHQLKQLGLDTEVEATDVKFGPLNFHILIGKKSEYVKLMPQINSALQDIINDGTLDKLTEKYLN